MAVLDETVARRSAPADRPRPAVRGACGTYACREITRLGGFAAALRQIVQDEALTDLLHCDALGFVRQRVMHVRGGVRVDARKGTAAKLFRTHGRDVNEQESTFDRGSLRTWRRRRLGF